jgi:DNA-binding beta-propeller fold protein YncE
VFALVLAIALGAYLVFGVGSNGGLGAIKANHIGLIDPRTNDIVAEIPVGIQPGPVAAGAGSVWVGNQQDRSLTKIDPSQRTATATFPLENRTPTGIAVGLGAVWVAHGLRGQLSRVDPQFGQVTRLITVGGTAFGSPNGSVALDARSVWVAFGDSTFAHLDAVGRVLGKTLAGSQPAGLVVAAGSVWVTNSGDGTVQRFSPATFREGPIQFFNAGTQPTGITYADGAIWVQRRRRLRDANRSGIRCEAGYCRRSRANGTRERLGRSLGSEHVLGTVSRIDPTTNDVVATIEIGNAPAGLVAAGGFVWVTAQKP